MEKLSLSSSSPSLTIPPLFPVPRAQTRKLSFHRFTNPNRFSILASKSDGGDDSSKLSQWDLMELRFGSLIGEDPKLTLAKIKGRKLNPDSSFDEIEKNFNKNKGKLVQVKEVPFDVPEKRGSVKAENGLNLVKPVPKKGIKVGDGEDSLKLPEIKRPNVSLRHRVASVTKSNVPNVILHRPSVYNEQDDETDSSSRLRIKPNLSVSMRTEPVKENFGGMTLLKKPEAFQMDEEHESKTENGLMNGSVYSGPTDGAAADIQGDTVDRTQSSSLGGLTLSRKPNVNIQQNTDGYESILRKPSVYNEQDEETDSSSRTNIKSNLSLSMRTEPVKEKFGGMTLLNKPEAFQMDEEHASNNENGFMNGSVYSGPTDGAASDIQGDMVDRTQSASPGGLTLSRKPNVNIQQKSDGYESILRKPSVYYDQDEEADSSSRINIKSNLSLSMRTEPVKEKFGGMTLLKKPEAFQIDEDHESKNENGFMNGSVYSGPTDGAAADIQGGMVDRTQSASPGGLTLSRKPNVNIQQKTGRYESILRKSSVYNDQDEETDSPSGLRIKPNLSLSMRTEPVKEKFSGMTLLKRLEAFLMDEDHKSENENGLIHASVSSGPTNGAAADIQGAMVDRGQIAVASNVNIQQNTHRNESISRSNRMVVTQEDRVDGFPNSRIFLSPKLMEASQAGMQHYEESDIAHSGQEVERSKPPTEGSSNAVDSILIGRPKRLGRSVKEVSHPLQEKIASSYPKSFNGEDDQEKLLMSGPLTEREETDWSRIELRFYVKDRVEVELISCSPRGFVVSFGSLIGFLPYRNLAFNWKFLAFESWLRKNDLDPSKFRQRLGIIGIDAIPNKGSFPESLSVPGCSQRAKVELTADMELEDLLRIYDQEKMQYLSSFLGQIVSLKILVADRKSRELIFSMRSMEKEEAVERKRSLMAKLSVGDVVKCCIKKMTYSGIFVEVEGVPALIHQTEVSWEAPLDPTSQPKIGQIVEAKVHQLDFESERIFLSLKELTPDPLNEALECIVGNCSSNEGLKAAQVDSEWAEVDSLVKELQQVNGVQTVTKGRFFLSPGLAPTFQVYMASMFENQYKLLARSGKKVQEVMVQASLDKEEMKSAVLKCTNRVES